MPLSPTSWRASGRYRDSSGTTRQYQGWGPSRTKSRESLLEKPGNAVVTSHVLSARATIAELGVAWLDEKSRAGGVSKGSISTYRQTWRAVVDPEVGRVRVRELTVGRARDLMLKLHEVSPSRRKRAQAVLAPALDLAVQHALIDSNPIRAVGRITPTAEQKAAQRRAVALSPREVTSLLSALVGYVQPQPGRGGRPRNPLVHRVALLMAGTGVRPGEARALVWADVNVAAVAATLSVTGTVVEPVGEAPYRQEWPKTQSGRRTVVLPVQAAMMLRELLVEQQLLGLAPGPNDLVFPSEAGRVISKSGLGRAWRNALMGTQFEGVEIRDFRSTVATALTEAVGVEAAAAQLGHSDSAVTKAHYVAKSAQVADFTAVLGPLMGDESVPAHDLETSPGREGATVQSGT